MTFKMSKVIKKEQSKDSQLRTAKGKELRFNRVN